MAVAGVLAEDDLARRAAAVLQASWPGAAVESVERLPGGASSLTFRAGLTGGPAAQVVIKAAPPGLAPVRNRDVLRQARLLRLIGQGSDVRVPDVYGCDPGDPPDVPPLFVMSFEPGQSDEPLQIPANLPPAQARGRALHAARMLAALHRVDPEPLGEQAITAREEVERWVRAIGTVPGSLRAGADETAARLLEHVPAGVPAALCHGDWRLGNTLCAGGEIVAVIDWEIWSVGDPRADLAWFLMMCDTAHPAAIVGAEAGLPPVAELVRAYLGGAGGHIPDLGWFRALAAFKQAAATALLAKHAASRGTPLEQVTARIATMLPEMQAWAGSFLDAEGIDQ